MTIDIDHLSEAELRDLNHRVVERLRLLSTLHTQAAMHQFRIGDRVSFETNGQGTATGVIVKFNQKSVVVVTEAAGKWKVAPCFLRPATVQATATVLVDDLPRLGMDKPPAAR